MKRRTFLMLLSSLPVPFILKPRERFILTTVKGTPVYEVSKELKEGDIMHAKYFKSVCDLPDPTNYAVAPSHYKGEPIYYSSKYVKKMWV